jgi:hypothetical protein
VFGWARNVLICNLPSFVISHLRRIYNHQLSFWATQFMLSFMSFMSCKVSLDFSDQILIKSAEEGKAG